MPDIALPDAQSFPVQSREHEWTGRVRRLYDIVAPAAQSFPGLSVVGALGLVLVAIAFERSRAGMQGADFLFWSGLITLIIPFGVRLAMPATSRSERIALVIFLGMGLYLVKVMQNPLAFTYPDEYVHVFNLDQVLNTGHLFAPNPLIQVTPLYHGLSIVASSVAAITGLSPFLAGLVVIGVARFLLVVGLFLLFEEISGSSRVAGLGVLAYTANPNFLFFSAQYAYESLALPLAVLIAALVISRLKTTDAAMRLGLGLVSILLVMTIVITHHLTSYALLGFLAALSVAFWIFYRGKLHGPILMTLFALVSALAWLLFVATPTVGYLSPVLGGAIQSVTQFLTSPGASRGLFSSTSGYVSPVWERVVALGGVLMTVIALPFGLRRIWNEYRNNPAAWLLGAAAVGYVGTLALRFFPAAWEIGNRASEFLFVGVGFVLALAATWMDTRLVMNLAKRAALAALFALIFMEGVIAGWPPLARLAQPYFVDAKNHVLNPEGVTAGIWALTYLGPNQQFAADPSNARALLVYGHQYPLTGSERGIRALLYANHIDQSVLDILANSQIRYVLVDRRNKSWDQMIGLYFDRVGQNTGAALFPEGAIDKFDQLARVRRIYDGGDIVIYDVGSLINVVPNR